MRTNRSVRHRSSFETPGSCYGSGDFADDTAVITLHHRTKLPVRDESRGAEFDASCDKP
jgi:hypothetical protein